ncbi:MAG: hypothetical protein ACHP65_02585 [Legionellales bacterium]
MPNLLFNSNVFNLIFGNAADIKIDERVPIDLQETKRQQRVQAINDKFALFINEPNFRAFLRRIHSTFLEDVLFGRHEGDLGEIAMPEDVDITTKFAALNEEYGYESLNSEANTYIQFFKLCKVFADFIECNNTEDNSVAYLHAYKLLVLFGKGAGQNTFAKIEAFTKQHVDGLSKRDPLIDKQPTHDLSLHDLLIQPIPKKQAPENKPPLTADEIQQWQKLIQVSGIKAIALFQQAFEINRHLGHSPTTINEAIQTSAHLSYSQAARYPELANLCIEHHISENIFDRCLEVEARRKTKDRLPSIVVDGANLQDAQHPEQQNYPGYTLVKLPIDDPRAYILGHITQCCQSMGGHSQACVIDGITRENNGFYVLLKGRDIIGQGYAWISENGNLTIDSWENRTQKQDDPVIIAMLRKLGELVTTDPKYPDIVRVTIGMGGKTPPMAGQALLGCSERMQEGTPYADSQFQRLIYLNQDKFDALQQELALILRDMSANGFAEVATKIKALGLHIPLSREFCQNLRTLFLKEDSLSQWNTITENNLANIKPIIAYTKQSPSHLKMLAGLKKIGMLTGELFNGLVKRANIDEETRRLQAFDELGYLTGSLGHCIVTALFNPSCDVRHALADLHQAGYFADKDLYDLIEAILQHPTYRAPGTLAKFFIQLNKNGLLTGEAAQPLRDILIKLMAMDADQYNYLLPRPFKCVEQIYTVFCNTALARHAHMHQHLLALIKHPCLFTQPMALEILEIAGLLNDDKAEEYCIVLESNVTAWPPALARALVRLHGSPLLIGDLASVYRHIIVTQNRPLEAYENLMLFHDAGFLGGPLAGAFRDLFTNNYPISEALLTLKSEALLTLKNAGLLKNAADVLLLLGYEDPATMANVWCLADKLQLLKDNDSTSLLKKLVEYPERSSLMQTTEGLQTLLDTHLLPDAVIADYFEQIMLHPSRIKLSQVFTYEQLLFRDEEASANFKTIVMHQQPLNLAWQLLRLQKAGLLNGDEADIYRQAVAHAKTSDLTSAFCYLQEKGLLADKDLAKHYRKLLIAHDDPDALAQAFVSLNEYNLSKGDSGRANMAALASHPNPCSLVYALYLVAHHGWFRDDTVKAYRNALSQHPDPIAFVRLLIKKYNDPMLNIRVDQASLLAKITELADGIEHLQGKRAQCFTIGKDEKAYFLKMIKSWGEKKFISDPLLTPVIKRFLLQLTEAACAEKRNACSLFKPHSLQSFEVLLKQSQIYPTELSLFSTEGFQALRKCTANTRKDNSEIPYTQMDALFQQCLEAHSWALDEDQEPNLANSSPR